MIIMISPTKQMKLTTRYKPTAIPSFVAESSNILKTLTSLTMEEIQKLMKVNEKIAKENQERYQHITFDMNGCCAIHTYHGLQFQYMQLESEEQLSYVQQHVRILSGFYGIVKPMDSIYPYRLEMQTALPVDGAKDMYEFWGEKLAKELSKELSTHQEPYLLNLASKEYEKAVLPYVDTKQVIHLIFQIRKLGKLKIESTQAKMARGRMIHYLSTNLVETLEGVKNFCEDGYQYQEELSDFHHLVFVKEVS